MPAPDTPDSERPTASPGGAPGSPYAREIAGARLRFPPELEKRYVQAHLQRVHLRVRVWFSLMSLISVGDILMRLRWLHPNMLAPSWAYDLSDLCSFLLAGLAWSKAYLRWYLPLARFLVPAMGAATALCIVGGIAADHDNERIAILATDLFVFFFFCGLMFRSGVLSCVVLMTAYAAAVIYYRLPMSTSVTSLWHLAWVFVLAAIGYGDIERSYRRTFLEHTMIAELVSNDELSGLTNRRAFYEHLPRVWQQAQREGRTLAIWMVDIDHFKSYNDSLGHQAGDAALRVVGQLLKGHTRRPLDLAARYGGDEFVAVFYDLPAARVRELAERLRQAVQDYHQLMESSGQAVACPAMTVCIGVAMVVPTAARSVQGAVQLADEALYEAKQAGRNRVVLKDAGDHELLDTGSFRQSHAG